MKCEIVISYTCISYLVSSENRPFLFPESSWANSCLRPSAVYRTLGYVPDWFAGQRWVAWWKSIIPEVRMTESDGCYQPRQHPLGRELCTSYEVMHCNKCLILVRLDKYLPTKTQGPPVDPVLMRF